MRDRNRATYQLGRRRMYLGGIAIFLLGSTLAGAAASMTTLIIARAIQGLGAGAIIPLSMTIVGDLYTLAERARTQATFSGVWGLPRSPVRWSAATSTDALSWRWVLAGASFVGTLFLPPVDFSVGVPTAAGEHMLAAEMTTLEPGDEPVGVPER